MASPYVTVHLSRKQAEAALKSLRWDAEGRAKSNPIWAVIRHFEDALASCLSVSPEGAHCLLRPGHKELHQGATGGCLRRWEDPS